MNAKRGRISVHRGETGMMEVEALVCAGLAMHTLDGYGRDNSNVGRWGITHVASGHGVGPLYQTMREARTAMARLLETDVDWTRPAEELRKLTGLRAMVERALETVP